MDQIFEEVERLGIAYPGEISEGMGIGLEKATMLMGMMARDGRLKREVIPRWELHPLIAKRFHDPHDYLKPVTLAHGGGEWFTRKRWYVPDTHWSSAREELNNDQGTVLSYDEVQ